MAKLKGPLFSFSASGKLGQFLVFRNNGGRYVAHKTQQVTKPGSPAQLASRANCSNARYAFSQMVLEDRQEWQEYATRKGWPVFAAFLAEWQFQRIEPGQLPLVPDWTNTS